MRSSPPSSLTPLSRRHVPLLASVAVLLFGAVREISSAEEAQIRIAVLQERRRIARDLHDGVAQELAYTGSVHNESRKGDQSPESWGRIVDTVERALDESRAAINALSRPESESLVGAIEETAAEVAERGGARLRVRADERIVLPAEVGAALLRIVREAVGNAVRHGASRSILVVLEDGNGTTLRVTDDGVGFDPDSPKTREGFGLTSMRERTESLGGVFRVSSEPSRGTTIEAILP